MSTQNGSEALKQKILYKSVKNLDPKLNKWFLESDWTGESPVHNSILITDYLTKMGIKTVSQPPYSPDLAPCDFW